VTQLARLNDRPIGPALRVCYERKALRQVWAPDPRVVRFKWGPVRWGAPTP
jgi:hypothetical protein